MSKRNAIQPAAVVVALLLLASPIPAAPRTFVPDYIFSGSNLTTWRALGDAEWKAQNGEIVGTPRADAGGWLIFDRSFQTGSLGLSLPGASDW